MRVHRPRGTRDDEQTRPDGAASRARRATRFPSGPGARRGAADPPGRRATGTRRVVCRVSCACRYYVVRKKGTTPPHVSTVRIDTRTAATSYALLAQSHEVLEDRPGAPAGGGGRAATTSDTIHGKPVGSVRADASIVQPRARK